MKHVSKIASMVLALLLVMSSFMTIPFAASAANPTPDRNKDGTLPDGATPDTGTATGFSGGDGTAENPYQIKDVTEFRYFQSQAKSDASYLTLSYILTGNIYFNEKLDYTDAETGLPGNVTLKNANAYTQISGTFSGTFDGDGYGIYNLYARFANAGALFGTVTGTIKNLSLYGGYVYFGGGTESGSLAQTLNGGTLSNCYSSVGIYAKGVSTGGFVGKVTGNPTIEDCIYAGAISAPDSNASNQIGGIVARAESAMTIARCANYAPISTQFNRVGGMVGFFIFNAATVTITDCVNRGNLTSTTGKADGGIGGIVGLNYSNNYNGVVNYLRCANYGDITASSSVGATGMAGDAGNVLSYSFCANYGNVTGKTASGLHGTASGITFANCYSEGTFTALTTGATIGLIAGWIKNGTTMKNCVGTGSVDLYGGSGSVNTVENNQKYDEGALDVAAAVTILNTGVEEPVFAADKGVPVLTTLPGVEFAYKVTFKWYDSDGTLQSTEVSVGKGQAATPPVLPTEKIEGIGYFAKWDSDAYLEVTDDLTITALYGEKITITFLPEEGDTPIDTIETIAGAELATLPTAPEKTGYRFAGWSPDPATLTESGSVRATYIKVWQVRFLQPDGVTQIGATQIIDDGAGAVAPDKSLVDTGDEDHIFLQWDTDFAEIHADTDVTAVLMNAPLLTVTYYDSDRTTVLGTEIVRYGNDAPYKYFAKPGYYLTGWEGELTAISGTTDVYAIWEDGSVWDGKTIVKGLAGSGTKEDPYLIGTAAEFFFYEANTATYAAAGTYTKQIADLDFGGKKPLAKPSATVAGTYDGNGKTIRNFVNGTNGWDTWALFLTVTGTVKNLTLSSVSITAQRTNAAALCVTLSGTVENCHVVSGKICGAVAGGLVAKLDGGTIRNCSFDGTLEICTNKATGKAGGIVAEMVSGTVESCTVKGILKANSFVYTNKTTGEKSVAGSGTLGGIVGSLEVEGKTGAIIDCVNNATIIGGHAETTEKATLGGIFGKVGATKLVAEMTVRDCRNNGTLQQITDGPVGGIIGEVARVKVITVENCENYGSITAASNIGGIVGYLDFGASGAPEFVLRGCLNAADITASGDRVGGMIGFADRWLQHVSVISCANKGNITGANYVGGIIGYSATTESRGQLITVLNTMVLGNVTATGNYAGLVAGSLMTRDTNSILQITNSLFVGNVTAANYAAALLGGVVRMTGTKVTTTETKLTVTGSFVKATVSVSAGAQTAIFLAGSETPEITNVTVTVENSRFAVTLMQDGTAVTDPKAYYTGDGTGVSQALTALGEDELADGTVQALLNEYAKANNLMIWYQGGTTPELRAFYIKPADITNERDLSHGYTGEAVEAETTVNPDRSDVARVDVTYYSLSDLETPLPGAPSAVGKYRVILRVYDADGNELDRGNDFYYDFEITKAKTEIVPDLSGFTKRDDGTYSIEYTGNQVLPGASLRNLANDKSISGATIVGVVTKDGVTVTAIEPGIYVITFTFAGDENCEAAEASFTFEIVKKKITYPENKWTANGTDILADGAELEYNRLEQILRLAGLDESIFEVIYSQNAATVPGAAMTATATVSLRAGAEGCYILEGEAPTYTITWSIVKASVKIIVVRDAADVGTEVKFADDRYEFTGSEETFYVVFVDRAGNILGTPAENTIVIGGAGLLERTFTYGGDENYRATTLTLTITVQPKNLGENGGTHADLNRTYDGTKTTFAPDFGNAPEGTTWAEVYETLLERKNGDTYEKVTEAIRGGIYRVTFTRLTADGNYKASFTVTFTIARATATVTPPATGWTKDGDTWTMIFDRRDHAFIVSSDSDATPEVTYDRDGKADLPNVAGSYTVTVTLAETDNYEALQVTFKVRVDQKVIPTVPTGTALWNYKGSFTYDGTEMTVAALDAYRAEWGDYLSFLYEDEAKTRAGSYTATLTLTLKDTINTRFEEDATATQVVRTLEWTIAKRVLSVDGVTLDDISGVYNGAAYTVEVTLPSGLRAWVNVHYEWSLDGTTYTGTAIDAGVYSVVAVLTLKDDSTEFPNGATEYRTSAATVEITQNEAEIGGGDRSLTYNGEVVDPLTGLTLTGSDGTVFAIADYLTVALTKDGKRVAEIKDAGVYRVTVSVSDDPNVTAESITFTVTVNRATYSVDGKITVVGDTTYIAGKAGEINLRVALTGADGVTVRVDDTRLPELPNTPGKHIVTFYLIGSDNYEPLAAYEVEVTVKQAVAKDAGHKDVSIIFDDGADPDIKFEVVENEVDDDVKNLLLDSASLGLNIVHPKLAGLYRYTFKDADGNAVKYSDIGEISVVITLPKRYQGYDKAALFDEISVVSVTYKKGIAAKLTVQKAANVIYDAEAGTLTFKVAGPDVAYGYVREASPVATYVTLGLGGVALVAVIALTVVRIVGTARRTRPEGPDTPDGSDAGFGGYGDGADSPDAGDTYTGDSETYASDAYTYGADETPAEGELNTDYASGPDMSDEAPVAEEVSAEEIPAEELPAEEATAEELAEVEMPAEEMPVPDKMPTPDEETPHEEA